jgi:TPR repeat protein
MANIEIAAVNRTVEPNGADECFRLGMSYSSGAGVRVDLIEAHKWFNIAAARGHNDAARMRREVAELMSDSEIGSAQRAARDWLRTRSPAPARVVLAAA